MQREFPSLFSLTAMGHDQPRAVVGADQLRGHQKDLVAQGLQRCGLEVRGQTQPLEPVDQIVSQQQEMKIGFVGQKVMRWDLAQVITAFEFANDPFHARAAVVEAPQVQWLQGEIGDEHLIVIVAQLEQRQLLAGCFRLGSSHHYEPITCFPSGWLIEELSSRNVSPVMVIAQAGQSLLDGPSQLGGHDKASLSLFQPGNGLVVVETLVGANDNLSDASGKLGKTSGEQVAHSGPGVSVTWTQFSVPEVF